MIRVRALLGSTWVLNVIGFCLCALLTVALVLHPGKLRSYLELGPTPIQPIIRDAPAR
ncbi:MAG TPA: hypothetical protein VHD87_15445 [Acidimicrobiales bacterium]|nr:hypothetical protein [Acidimicrobiales bacterium]